MQAKKIVENCIDTKELKIYKLNSFLGTIVFRNIY